MVAVNEMRIKNSYLLLIFMEQLIPLILGFKSEL